VRFKTLIHGPVYAFARFAMLRGGSFKGDFLQLTRLFVVALTFIILDIAAVAQNALPKEMLYEASDLNSPAASPISPVEQVSLPDAPVPQRPKARVIDKKFVAIIGALAGAETLRFTTHKLVLDNEYAAGAPWVTSVPKSQHLVLEYGAIYAAEFLVAYELKKPHSWLPGDKFIQKLWWVYPAVMTPIHIKNGVRSIQTKTPAGTTAEDCPPEYQQYCGQ
jgi:hypothetical protein